jgi:hypothetical protein
MQACAQRRNFGSAEPRRSPRRQQLLARTASRQQPSFFIFEFLNFQTVRFTRRPKKTLKMIKSATDFPVLEVVQRTTPRFRERG